MWFEGDVLHIRTYPYLVTCSSENLWGSLCPAVSYQQAHFESLFYHAYYFFHSSTQLSKHTSYTKLACMTEADVT
jgi:hypothetical protein